MSIGSLTGWNQVMYAAGSALGISNGGESDDQAVVDEPIGMDPIAM